jgi:hypothetical protein
MSFKQSPFRNSLHQEFNLSSDLGSKPSKILSYAILNFFILHFFVQFQHFFTEKKVHHRIFPNKQKNKDKNYIIPQNQHKNTDS